jgi:transcriptional regulator with XRE-family HTH domain
MDVASPQIFGTRIRRIRKRQGLTGAQVCTRAGISGHNLVTRIEKAQSEPGLFKAARLAAALGVSLDALLAPPECVTCDGIPPAGFICPDCHTRGATP